MSFKILTPAFCWLILSVYVIRIYSQVVHRCSHVPPSHDLVTRLWLNEGMFNLSTQAQDIGLHSIDGEPTEIHTNDNQGKEKRHVIHNHAHLTNSDASSSNTLSKQEQTWKKDEYVPMKIQIFYDKSIHLLEQNKLDLIVNTVMPSVVKFFESALSISRVHTIDRFRFSRRCPNNTIYYAKDTVGISKPFCMNRCEDYAVCGEIIVPPAHLSACSYCNMTTRRCSTNYSNEGNGITNAQLLLYVSARQTLRCKKDQTIAYAVHCAQDFKTNRPIAGHANLCPSSIRTDAKDLRALIATVKHELTHVLGFSLPLFAYFRDKNGKPLTERDPISGFIHVDPKTGYAKWSDKVIKKVLRKGWKTGAGLIDKEVHLVVTPTVVKEVRNLFNCSSLEGAELEDQGSDGTSMTHWEKRLFGNEAMTGTHTENSVYSRLTLAVLQDTGWYKANFSLADQLEWGKGLGCEFAKQSCKSWIEERKSKRLSIKPFCDIIKRDSLQISCTDDHSSKAICNMKQYSEPLPLAYQNFDSLEGVSSHDITRYGGSVDLADYCPFSQEFTWQIQNMTVRGSRCDLGGNSLELERNAVLESFGPQTKCFEHGRRWEHESCLIKRDWHHYGAGCYHYSCTNGHIKIFVGNRKYSCYYPQQQIHITHLVDQWLYNGTIICPSCEKICPANECVNHDKRVIDKILNAELDLLGLINDEDIEPSRSSIDIDSTNLIDHFIDTKSRAKNESSKFKSLNVSLERLKHKDHLFKIISELEKPPVASLICSHAQQLGFTFPMILLMLTTSSITLLCNNVLRLNFRSK